VAILVSLLFPRVSPQRLCNIRVLGNDRPSLTLSLPPALLYFFSLDFAHTKESLKTELQKADLWRDFHTHYIFLWKTLTQTHHFLCNTLTLAFWHIFLYEQFQSLSLSFVHKKPSSNSLFTFISHFISLNVCIIPFYIFLRSSFPTISPSVVYSSSRGVGGKYLNTSAYLLDIIFWFILFELLLIFLNFPIVSF